MEPMRQAMVCDGCGVPRGIHPSREGLAFYCTDDGESGPQFFQCGEWVTEDEWAAELRRLRASDALLTRIREERAHEEKARRLLALAHAVVTASPLASET